MWSFVLLDSGQGLGEEVEEEEAAEEEVVSDKVFLDSVLLEWSRTAALLKVSFLKCIYIQLKMLAQEH